MEAVRAFFAEREVLEVTTPCVIGAPTCEPDVAGVRCEDGWLRSSPEFEMKRLLAAGSGDVWQMGPAFRGGERGARHRPEFTLIEWYRVGWDYRRLLDETAELLSCLLRPHVALADCVLLPYRDAFIESFGVDPFGDERHVCTAAARHGCEGCDAAAALDFLLTVLAAEHLPRDRLVALHDFPPRRAAYARVANEGRATAHARRFEIFYRGIELADGAQEWTEAADYRACFAADRTLRALRGMPVTAPDEAFLSALERRALPECAGVAVGFERLLMCMSGAEDIGEVLVLR